MINRVQLRDDLVVAFTENELETLSEQLEISYASLHGKTQRDRFTVLIGRLERQNRLPDLVLALVLANPNYKERYAAYLESTVPGKLSTYESTYLLDLSQGGGSAVEEPPTMTWDTRVSNEKDEDEGRES